MRQPKFKFGQLVKAKYKDVTWEERPLCDKCGVAPFGKKRVVNHLVLTGRVCAVNFDSKGTYWYQILAVGHAAIWHREDKLSKI